jgi:hypothetical protein
VFSSIATASFNSCRALNADGKKIFGYGASTKGNVLLQFCGFTEKEIPYIAEVNPDKFGRFTPGSRIPIISEAEAAGNEAGLLSCPALAFQERHHRAGRRVSLWRRADDFPHAGNRNHRRMKLAIIVGAAGQDGSPCSQLLTEKVPSLHGRQS